jgi:hypothetical protein
MSAKKANSASAKIGVHRPPGPRRPRRPEDDPDLHPVPRLPKQEPGLRAQVLTRTSIASLWTSWLSTTAGGIWAVNLRPSWHRMKATCSRARPDRFFRRRLTHGRVRYRTMPAGIPNSRRKWVRFTADDRVWENCGRRGQAGQQTLPEPAARPSAPMPPPQFERSDQPPPSLLRIA